MLFNINKPILQEIWDEGYLPVGSNLTKKEYKRYLDSLSELNDDLDVSNINDTEDEEIEDLLNEMEDLNDNLNDIDSSFYEAIYSQENILNLLLKLQKNKNPELILKNIKILKNIFEKLEENYEKFNDFMKKIKNIESSLQENKKIEEKKKVLKKVKID